MTTIFYPVGFNNHTQSPLQIALCKSDERFLPAPPNSIDHMENFAHEEMMLVRPKCVIGIERYGVCEEKESVDPNTSSRKLIKSSLSAIIDKYRHRSVFKEKKDDMFTKLSAL